MDFFVTKQKEIVPDPWLAQIFKRDVYQIFLESGVLKKSGTDLHHLIHELQDHSVFLYAKVPVIDAAAIQFLEDLQFHLVDTHVTFEKLIENTKYSLSGYSQIRFAEPQDQSQTVNLALGNCTTSRFHLDPLIPTELANQIKAEWAGNYFKGARGDRMIVASAGNKLAGFLQILYRNDRTLTIDLIATDAKERRKGIASDMIAFAVTELTGFSKLRVGTQISNIPSLRLYEKLNFQICASDYIFHFHHSPNTE